MKIKIFTMTHKAFTPPNDPIYVPLQVGRAVHEDLGYQGDDTGDNISAQNCYYSELTGLYWIWKNVTDADVTGLCHYRRYLLNEQEQLLNESDIYRLLNHYDILTSMKLTLNFPYAYGFRENHSPEDLQAACEVIENLYPDFYPLFAKRLQENHTYFGNIMICKKPLLDDYCRFLFPIFQKMHPLLSLEDYDDYHKRLYGFLSEFLLMVWCEYKKLRVRECKVGMVGAKKETSEVIHRLWQLLSREQIAEAKACFLAQWEKRPDLLMEASDLHGYLRLCLQVISICEYEASFYGGIVFPLSYHHEELMHFMEQLNQAVLSFSASSHLPEPRHIAFLKQTQISDCAILITTRLLCRDAVQQRKVTDDISKACDRPLSDTLTRLFPPSP